MNNKYVRNLSIVLALQLALIAYFYTRGSQTATFNPTEPLLSVNLDAVTKIEIVENKKDGDNKKEETLVLEKRDNKWLLPAYFEFPVSEVKFNDFVKAIAEEKRSWPVGKSASSAKKFKVTDADFERKIVFHQGDSKKETVYLGDSPGFRKVYVRVDGGDTTYTLKYNASDLPTDAKKWADKSYAKLERDAIAKVELGELVLVNKDGGFEVDQLKDNEQSDVTKVSAIMNQVTQAAYEEVAGKKDAVKKGVEEFSYRVTLAKSNEIISYSFSKAEDGKKDDKDADLVMTVSSLPFAFLVKESKVSSLRNLKRMDYIKEKGKAEAADATEPKVDAKAISGDNTPAEPSARSM